MKNRVREYRKDKKLTQVELAEIIGTCPKMISLIENSIQVPGLKIIYKMCDFFGCTVEDLFMKQ